LVINEKAFNPITKEGNREQGTGNREQGANKKHSFAPV
jgi:hypothetical protein